MNKKITTNISAYCLLPAFNILFFVIVTIIVLLRSPVCNARDNYVFVLQGLNSSFNSSILDRNFIDGMALQIGWRDVERAQGKYNWQRVDQLVAEAKSRNKRITLHLLPLHPPEWIFTAGAERYCFTMPARSEFMRGGRELCEILPWDPVYLEHWSRLIAEFGKHYNNNPTVLAVSVTAPAPEMVLPGAIPGTQTFLDMQKRFNKDVYLNAWKQMINAYQLSFPDKIKFIAPGMVLFDEFFADDVIRYAQDHYGKKLWLFNAGLRADGVPQKSMGTGHIASRLEAFAKEGVLGLQTIWNATDDPGNRMRGTLPDVLKKGMQMGASYFEIYAIDVQNPELQTRLADFKRQLCGCEL